MPLGKGDWGWNAPSPHGGALVHVAKRTAVMAVKNVTAMGVIPDACASIAAAAPDEMKLAVRFEPIGDATGGPTVSTTMTSA